MSMEAGRSWAKCLTPGASVLLPEMVGVGSGAMDMTFEYLKTRKQFDRVIGEFQALQHRAAHLYGEMEGARSIVLKAQSLMDEGHAKAELYVAAAKAKAGLVLQFGRARRRADAWRYRHDR